MIILKTPCEWWKEWHSNFNRPCMGCPCSCKNATKITEDMMRKELYKMLDKSDQV